MGLKRFPIVEGLEVDGCGLEVDGCGLKVVPPSSESPSSVSSPPPPGAGIFHEDSVAVTAGVTGPAGIKGCIGLSSLYFSLGFN